jgi:hypothetical protein
LILPSAVNHWAADLPPRSISSKAFNTCSGRARAYVFREIYPAKKNPIQSDQFQLRFMSILPPPSAVSTGKVLLP